MACALISADEIKLKGLSLKVEERFIDENKVKWVHTNYCYEFVECIDSVTFEKCYI